MFSPISKNRNIKNAARPPTPVIQPNYLASDADLEALVTGFKLMRPLVDTKAFTPFVGKEFEPGPQVQSDDDIRAFIRNRAETVCDPVGTCKMGVDSMAVVDPQLRVRGTQGLRVTDASIMPFIPNGNTNAPSIMIGEKAAALLHTTDGERGGSGHGAIHIGGRFT